MGGRMMLGGTFVSGVEPDSKQPELLRVYVGARYRHLYVLIEDPDDQDAIRSAWGHGGHVLIPRPPDDAICFDEEGYAAMKQRQGDELKQVVLGE